ncbi:short-subunit dehydrogenase [Kibdelosporangium banguiense]|uniref:Short-subunit dehydrogenase n=1 Tax=Kibdelosporangium banguiense TaxID=1365924 RepID=A0ABS4TR93_9PSEU|nr:SDR family NAD(P)-dependent oxidoreductase [Kibdelosporangium banguiense]MBP2326465.1 short-subunit dehydrogenase [Kibdelosporangium banguiense]
MPVIAIVGAGPGLGIQIAHAFGAKGFKVALVARNAGKLDALVAELHAEGIEAAGFTGDIGKPETVAEAFTRIKERFGPVDVLEFSPADQALGATGVLEVTPETLQPQIDFYITGAIQAVKQVAPDMIAAKSGAILITTGGGSITPVPFLANINIAAAGLRNWTLNLHNELKPQGIYVAHIAISAWIGAGHPGAAPDVIARSYVELYETRAEPELHYIALGK